jgi:signal recognition particle subunit SRP72
MASSVPNLNSLLRRTTLDDHSEFLRAANNALAKSSSDSQAEQVKIVALLKLDRFDDALRVFQDAGDRLKEKASLEYAYALYKAGELEEAEKIASKAESRAMRHVLAQAVS